MLLQGAYDAVILGGRAQLRITGPLAVRHRCWSPGGRLASLWQIRRINGADRDGFFKGPVLVSTDIGNCANKRLEDEEDWSSASTDHNGPKWDR